MQRRPDTRFADFRKITLRFTLTAVLKVLFVGLLPAALITPRDAAGDETHRVRPESLAAFPAGYQAASITNGRVTVTSDKWAGLVTPDDHEHLLWSTTAFIEEPAKQFGFFGSSWSVWPDPLYGDGGFEIGLLLRGGKSSGYRVQLSHHYQQVALVRYPEGGYICCVPCDVKLKTPIAIIARVTGNEVFVTVNGQEKIHYVDPLDALLAGRAGLLTSSQAKVTYSDILLRRIPAKKPEAVPTHDPNFSVRTWLGGRSWVFDGDEPILLLPVPEATYINNVKLRPGYKPQLSWNSHWDIQNQGAYPEGNNTNSAVKTSGGGKSLVAEWTGRQTKDRFVTRSKLTVGWDSRRSVYTYDVDSELEVLPGDPFHFRYGYDFEHHTPLDPFQWQYLIVKRDGETINRRPVYPIDPGPMSDVQQYHGARVWYGRHNETMRIAPAVEYDISPDLNPDPDDPAKSKKRTCNTAVCAAFYDTGVSFAPETAKPGTKVRVKYRYTGWPADEAKALFERSTIYDSPTLDPNHHYLFADEWPKLTFSQHLPMSEAWVGRTPFMTGHNRRPTYELATKTGVGSGFAMKLGPGSYGKATLPAPSPLPAGRWIITALVKSDNTHGQGGRIELSAVDPKSGRVLKEETHYLGNGSFDWKRTGFATDVPGGAPSLAIAFGNAGTGDAFITDVEFRRLDDGQPLPEGVAARPNSTPPAISPAPEGAIADYRMQDGKGLFVHDYANGPFGRLELANVDFVTNDGRPALRFADNTTGKARYPLVGNLDLTYLKHSGYKGRDMLPVAVAGTHGGGFELKAFTLAAWIKPAAQMGKSEHGGLGDVLGVGARRLILSLYGQEAPYKLGARLNVNDRFTADETRLEAGRWYHVALTGEPTATGKWRIRLYLDGRQVLDGTTEKLTAPLTIPPSIILGAEIFYFHDAYYRGLIGRTLVFDRALPQAAIRELAK